MIVVNVVEPVVELMSRVTLQRSARHPARRPGAARRGVARAAR